MPYRVGIGYDVHRLEEGIDFWLGGVKIEHHKGATGHSDADVIIHAICDAILGAANLGDIGQHFPDTDAAYKGIDSKILLKRVMELLEGKWSVVNIDTALCLQVPKIKPYIAQMKTALASVMQLDENEISIKATTNEKLGFVGREEGVSAYSVVLLRKI